MCTVYMGKLRYYEKEGRPISVEVLYPPTGKRGIPAVQFRLAGTSVVRVGSFNGLWEKFQSACYSGSLYYAPDINRNGVKAISVKVEVYEAYWKCDPIEIVRSLEDLTGKISRRNRQIASLREKLVATK